ncbi:SRPBCC domain-containing protein [Mycetocola manganoxydans]|uniref:SRPBCC domain-containing protein n=1 Tax=Mycetocola manganoxydans TaxID=699879 RepID=A0A3L6ZWS9_9MICO|nr:SRPBCC domain-containing protein [Mycetocola manganoxydans]RLP72349.1 SRPBCC domain-containing protein [Mycetocola manganoxydans]GHD40820.1 activator of HSP90 ATPase [Mycetocola manganoxydans]
MTVISTNKDVDNLTFTIVAEFDAGPEAVWQVWENPRLLERWRGPPTWPATFEKLEFAPGGDARYYMSGPDGEKARGWWKIVSMDAPRRFAFDDGFAGDDGKPLDPDDTTRCEVTLAEDGNVTRMTSVTTFRSAEQLEQMVEMGMEEGTIGAMGQIDAVLADVRVGS